MDVGGFGFGGYMGSLLGMNMSDGGAADALGRVAGSDALQTGGRSGAGGAA